MSNLLELVSGLLRYTVIAAIIALFANFSIVRNNVYLNWITVDTGGLPSLPKLIAYISIK